MDFHHQGLNYIFMYEEKVTEINAGILLLNTA